MSRIGNKHIDLPAGVTVEVNGDVCVVKGPKGTLEVKINKGIIVVQSLLFKDSVPTLHRRIIDRCTLSAH